MADSEIFGGGDDKNFKHQTSKIWMCCNQARSQKFAMEQLFLGSGVEPPALKNFAFFCKNNLILELL